MKKYKKDTFFEAKSSIKALKLKRDNNIVVVNNIKFYSVLKYVLDSTKKISIKSVRK